MAAGRNLDIKSWLSAMGLQDYTPCFQNYTRMEEIVHFTERELQSLGVREGAHLARMAASLAMLREKLYKKGKNKTPGTSPKGSTNVSPASVYSHPDYGTVPPGGVNCPDYVPIQIPFQQLQQQLGYIQMAPSPTDGPEASQELYKYLWYHGSVPRQRAEKLVVCQGDFLVRDSISQPGNYVMTCCWQGQPLHFVIDRTFKTDSNGVKYAQYCFEEQSFPRVSELIQHYIAQRKPVSDKSGAIISTPVNRTGHSSEHADMRIMGVKMAAMTPGTRSGGQSPRGSPFGSPTGTPTGSPQMQRRNVPRRKGSQPLLDQGPSETTCCRGDTAIYRRGSAPMMRPSNSNHVIPSSGSAPVMTSGGPPQVVTSGGGAAQTQSSVSPYGQITSTGSGGMKHSSSSDSVANLPIAPPAPCCVQAQSQGQSAYYSPGPMRMPQGPNERSSNSSVNSAGRKTPPNKSPNPSLKVVAQPACRSCTPPPKPSRVPTTKKSKKPVVHIRNQELYADDGKDYTDYAQVKAWSNMQLKKQSSLVEATTQLQMESKPGPDDRRQTSLEARPGGKPKLHAKPEEDNDYDNNFDLAARMSEETDYDVPKNRKFAQKAEGDEKSQSDSEATTPQNGDMKKDLYTQPVKKNRDSGGSEHGTEDSITPTREEPLSEINPIKLPKMTMTLPDLEPPSTFDLTHFKSDFLPPENKPLEGHAMKALKALLLTAEPRRLAEHMTSVDLDLAKVTGKQHLGVGVFSGLEYLTLPQGHQMRIDLMERHYSQAKFVSLSILVCAKFPERAQMLHQWIQTANELRGTLGNLFGFAAVMAGIRAPQVLRLRNTWLSLKQRFPHSAFLHESKLTGAMRSMDEGGSSLPLQNVTIPHVLPLIELLERDHDLALITEWENSKADYGLDILLAHLDTARVITEQYGLYRVTAENILRDFKPRPDFLDIFRTELHLKLLWGAKGAGVNPKDRYNKFEQLLGVLSERAEPPLNTAEGGETSL